MKKIQKICFLFLIFSLTLLTHELVAQDRGSGASLGKSSEQIVKKLLRKARNKVYDGRYPSAIKKYIQILKIDSTNFDYNFELALTYYYIDSLKLKSVPYFEAALRHSSQDTIGEIYYFLGNLYQLTGKYEEAISAYEKYLRQIKTYVSLDLLSDMEVGEFIDNVNRQMEMCINAKDLIAYPIKQLDFNGQMKSFEITDLDKNINSKYDEYTEVLSLNDSMLYFTSRREGSSKGKIDLNDEKFYEDIYVSKLTETGWVAPTILESTINSKNHEAPISLSPSGNRLYIYRGVRGGRLYYSDKKDNKWSKPIPFIQKKSPLYAKNAWQPSFTFSGDTVLYLVSNQPGGLGGRDIYKSTKQSDGMWGTVQNLGPMINTDFDEDAPFISADGNTLYFSSTGRNSMGGFDIFKSTLVNNQWTEAQNIGYPINSAGNDIYFIYNHKGDLAYYSSSKVKDGKIDMNIYSIVPEWESIQETVLKGWLSTQLPLVDATLILADKETKMEIKKIAIDNNGNYTINISPGHTYVVTLKGKNILPVSEEIKIPLQYKPYDLFQIIELTQEAAQETSKKMQVTIFKDALFNVKGEITKSGTIISGDNYQEHAPLITKIGLNNNQLTYKETKVSAVIEENISSTASNQIHPVTDTIAETLAISSFRNILFDYDKSAIRKEYADELDKIVVYLKNHKEVTIELSGHTDAKGTDDYNLKLSDRRVKSVLNYVVNRGISNRKIKANRFGKSLPIASNDTEEGRQMNRRVEIKIIN